MPAEICLATCSNPTACTRLRSATPCGLRSSNQFCSNVLPLPEILPIGIPRGPLRRERFWWRMLQLAGFGACRDQPPQAEACATGALLRSNSPLILLECRFDLLGQKPMFENLTDKLQRVFKDLRGQGKLTQEHVDEALAGIREALLEGDVNVGVIDELLTHIRDKALGSEVLLQLSPDQQVIKIVRDDLALLRAKHAKPLFASRPPSVWLMVGLQGSGKT